MNEEFRRTLGPWSAGALIAGAMIGTGIFFFVSDVAARVPGYGGILAAWALGAAIAGTGALSLAELAAAYPETGGVYVFIRKAYGSAAAFLYSWAKFLIMRPGSFAILAVAFAGFFADFLGLGSDASELAREPVAIAVILLLTIINIAGVHVGAWVQNVFTAAKLICLLLIVGVGAAYGLGLLEAHPVEIEAVATEGASGWSFVLVFGAALIPVLWTFGGWDEAPFVAEEVHNPERNLPLSILGGLAIDGVLYVVVNAAYLAIISPAEMAGSGGQTATVAMQRALGPWARRVLSLALMVSTFGAANGLALTGGRIAYATGQTQPLFSWFARTHVATKTPARSLIAQGAITCIAVLVLKDPYQLLLYTGLAYWVFAGLAAGAVIVLRWREPERERPFRVWGYPYTTIVFILASAVMAASVIQQSWHNAVAAVVILAIGAVAYVLQFKLPWAGKHRQPDAGQEDVQ